MPTTYHTFNLYKELDILNFESLFLKNLCLFMYIVKDDIDVPSHNHSTRLKFKSNIILPKMRTYFGQHYPKYTFIRFCNSNSVNVKL